MKSRSTKNDNRKNRKNFNVSLREEINLYQEIYDLEVINKEIRVNKEYFDYCKLQTSFIVLILYDRNGKVLLKDNGINQFELLGGRVFYSETVRDATKRIIYQEIGDIAIDELEPIALSRNTFYCEKEKIEHLGLVIMARIDLKNEDIYSFYELDENVLKCVNQFSDKEILKLFSTRFSNIVLANSKDFQSNEIETNRRYHLRYKFHNDIVKRYFLTSKIKKKEKLKEIMSKKAIGCSKFLDVSCGDNSLLFNLKYDDEFKFIVANDISWSQIELIPKQNGVFFTNHNAITFPFKSDAFDFVYCSNTLHHMPNKDSMYKLLSSLLRVGKKIVIYEIEDPKVTGGFPHLLNKYWYRGFLKDAGEEYLSYALFKEIVLKAYEGKAKIKFSNFRNIQGNYMIAEIEKNICD